MAHRFPSRWLGAALVVAGLVLGTATPVSGSTMDSTVDTLAAKVSLDRAADTRPSSVTGWYVEAGALVVEVHGKADGVTEWAARHGGAPVTVEHVADAPRPVWNLIAGQLIYSGSARCTLGFNARSGATRYVLAAGHCVQAGSTWYGVGGVIGPGIGSSFPGNDFGLIQVTSAAAVSTALIDRYSSGNDVTITGIANPIVGSSVCSSSPVGGWQCGSVTGINQTICYPQGCVTGMARTTLCAQPGSSGAPIVTNPGAGSTVRAVGLLSGGSGSCNTRATSYFQPIAEPLATYGLTLITG